MALNPILQYPGKIATPNADYPYGGAQNITVTGDGTGTPWEAALVNDVFGFQQALLKSAGLVPSGSPEKVTASQYLQSVVALASGRAVKYDESGVADVYVVDPKADQQGPGVYFDGMIVKFIPGNDNTGASTVNVDGLGVQNIKKGSPGVALTGGELVTTKESTITYDGTDFILTTPQDVNAVLLSAQSASASTSIDFIDQLDNAYYQYRLDFYNVAPVAVADAFVINLSDDSGVSYTADETIRSLSNTEILDGSITLYGASENRGCTYNKAIRGYGTIPTTDLIGGDIPSSVFIADSLQVSFQTGNIATGEFFLYGINPR